MCYLDNFFLTIPKDTSPNLYNIMQEKVNKKLIKCVPGNIYFQYITYLIDKPTDNKMEHSILSLG